MLIGNEYDVKIEKFSNQGMGIARINGQIVFVENVCPDDVARIKITHINKNYLTADLVQIIQPSPHRIEPFCPMQKVCGACQMQFIDYEYQLQLKKQIVEDAIKKIGQLDLPVNFPIASPKIKNYRQKIQYPTAQTKNSKRIVTGYYKPKTHDIVNIKYCPIQPEKCDEIIDYIRENFPKAKAEFLKHIVIRGSEYTKKFLVTLVVKKEFSELAEFSAGLYNNFEEITGVCININPKDTNVILSAKTKTIIGTDYIEEKILDKIFKIGPTTFFQVNPSSAENIFRYVKEQIKKFENPTVLDIYAGIAVFGIVVSDISKNVTSVEENPHSIALAKNILVENNVNNIELYANDSLKYLKSIKKKFDITVLDPPRKGCSQDVLNQVLLHTKKQIIYVSCNPATLARDLKYLTEHNCSVESIQPFDMFCHTYHIENVAIINLPE